MEARQRLRIGNTLAGILGNFLPSEETLEQSLHTQMEQFLDPYFRQNPTTKACNTKELSPCISASSSFHLMDRSILLIMTAQGTCEFLFFRGWGSLVGREGLAKLGGR